MTKNSYAFGDYFYNKKQQQQKILQLSGCWLKKSKLPFSYILQYIGWENISHNEK